MQRLKLWSPLRSTPFVQDGNYCTDHTGSVSVQHGSYASCAVLAVVSGRRLRPVRRIPCGLREIRHAEFVPFAFSQIQKLSLAATCMLRAELLPLVVPKFALASP